MTLSQGVSRAAVLAACLSLPLVGCSSASQESSTGSHANHTPLAVSDLQAVESAQNVLSYDVSWESSRAADTELDVACDGLSPWTIKDPTAASTHHAFLMGLITGVSCTLTARAHADGESASAETTIQVSQLPSYLPPIELSKPAAAGTLAPGWTLINLSNEHTGVPYIVALIDEKGRYRWYYQFPSTSAGSDTPVIQYQDGVVFGGDGVPLAQVTWQGKVVWKGPSSHHEVRPAETPGDFYYLVERDCASLTNHGSSIVDYQPSNDTELWSWNLCDHYAPPQDVPDWSHMNTVSLFPDKKSILGSSRNQNSVFKIDRASGNITWVMGFHGEVEDGFNGDFTIADADRFYHQHDTTILPSGHILMFDNGRLGVREYSRALEVAYTYNPSGTSEAHVVWEYRHNPDIFAPIWGSSERLENGDTLVCFGQRDPGVQSTIVEVASDSKPLWEVKTPIFWGVYRADRVADPPRGFVIP